jgi:hypothetical protein
MKTIKTNLQVILQTILFACSLTSAAEASQSADEIMKQVDYVARKSFSTQLALARITTCKYVISNGTVKCAEKPRVVVAEGVKKTYEIDGVHNDKLVSIVSEPISDKGMSLLVYEYGERGRDNDNWLYLPALGKVNRIMGSDDADGSVFGSEFSVETTENPEGRKIYEYTYKIVGEATYEGRPTWIIEIVPAGDRIGKTAYSKVVSWIDQEHYIPLKEDLYRREKIYKQRTQSGIRNVDGIFAATKVVMNNLSTSRISQMDRTSVRHNTEIPDEVFSQRVLTDFSFRERYLARFRAEQKQ